MRYSIIKMTSLVFALVITSCRNNSINENQNSAPKVTPYKTFVLQLHHMSGNVQLPGVMQSFQYVQIFPRINGFVKNIVVDRGTKVHKGDLLVSLEAPEIIQQVSAAKLKYANALSNFITSKDKYKRLKETSNTPGTISGYDLESALNKMQGDSAASQGEFANYKALESMRSYLLVTAPFDGLISERNVHPGALVGPGVQNAKPMVVLQQVSNLRLVVEVPEKYISQVGIGDTVHFKANSLPGHDFIGLVSRSSKSLNNTFRSETMEIDVENTEGQFKPGMYAEVSFKTKSNIASFVVPRGAIVTTTERKYIIVVSDNVTKQVDVSEGIQSGDSVEIFGSVKIGDEVISDANYQIQDGLKIR